MRVETVKSNLSSPSHGPRSTLATLSIGEPTSTLGVQCIVSVIASKGGLQEILKTGSKSLMVLNQAFRGNIPSSREGSLDQNSIRLGSDHKLTEPLVIGKILIR